MKQSEILSASNPRIKQWAQLLTKKGREEQRAFLLEGVHLTQEAFQSGVAVQAVLYLREKGIPPELTPFEGPDSAAEWIGVSDAVLAKCTETRTPQGIVSVCPKFGWTAADLLRQDRTLVAAVDGVQDPGNLGTIIRTADAVGATGVLLGRGTVDLYNPKTVRSTMGSLFHLPVVEADLSDVLPEAKRQGVQLVGTRLGAERNCYEIDMTGPTWFLLGNEGSGLSPSVSAFVDTDIMIPMRGKAESLNVAMAGTVLLYEAMRQRYYPPE